MYKCAQVGVGERVFMKVGKHLFVQIERAWVTVECVVTFLLACDL